MINTTKPRSLKLRLAAFAALSLEAALVLGMVAKPAAEAQTFKVLHTFTGGLDGGNPYGQPVVDNHGDVVGTTYFGDNTSNVRQDRSKRHYPGDELGRHNQRPF